MSARVLVCGATGFVGRNVAEALARHGGYDVTGVCHRVPPFERAGFSWVTADLTDARDAARVVAGVDVVVQAAATTSGAKDIVERPYLHVTDNAVMNSLLLRAAYHAGVSHFVFYSCSILYDGAAGRPLAEDDLDPELELHPRYFAAGWTKLYIERMCEFFSRLSRTRFTVLRHSNVYGPHDKFDLERSHVFGATVTKVMTAADGRVVVWGDGSEERDLLYVSDLDAAVLLALERQQAPFRIYNIGSGEGVSVRELVRRIVAASGRDLAIEHDTSKPSIDASIRLDCSRARRELGWVPKVPLDEGIARTLAWWRETYGS